MEASLPEKPSYRDLALTTLLSQLISAPADGDNREIQTEFYHRFKDEFFKRCHHATSRIFKGMPAIEAIRDDTIQDTFATAFEKIHGFSMNLNWNDQECEKVVLFWLSEIANNKLLKRYSSELEEKKFLNGEYKYYLKTERKPGSSGRRSYTPKYDKVKYDQLWEKLSPMAREIILLCAKHETLAEENKKHLPDSEIAYLREKYGVKSAAIRKAKERTIESLNACKL